MEGMLSPDYRWLWSAALAVALFFPVRKMIWVLAVRKEQRRADTEEHPRQGDYPRDGNQPLLQRVGLPYRFGDDTERGGYGSPHEVSRR